MESTFLIGLGWIGGLLARLLPGGPTWGWVLPLLIGAIGAFLVRRRVRLSRTWVVAGLIGALAWTYLGLRTPTPAPSDISFSAPQRQIAVVGEVVSDLKLTRSERLQFNFAVESFTDRSGQTETATGQVYVTVSPKDVGDLDLHPSQTLKLTGSLYTPSPARNPGSFDFQSYLLQRGMFAGLSAYEVEIVDPGRSWGGWAMRRRIRQALIKGLGNQQGGLLSSLVLGSRAGQLDYTLQDAFREVGLAHVLAASGFHVTLLIAVVLAILRESGPRQRQTAVFAFLGIYILLTGFSPSVLRAAIMGVAATLVLTEPRLKGRIRLNPLGTLLAAAVLLLIVQPIWIQDLGFQLSFMATLGLLVGIEPTTRRLGWMPLGLAVTIALPIVAMVWTLPLQLWVFGRIPTYAVLANVLTTILVVPILVGGFCVCGLALLVPPLGSWVAVWLKVLLTPLINIVTAIASWPGSSYYAGSFSWIQCLLLYGALLGLVFWPQWREKFRWQGTGLIMAVIFWVPGLLPGPPLQITALATGRAPILVIETRQQTVVINSGSPSTAEHTLLPFLRRQGIRRIEDVIATTAEAGVSDGWESVVSAIPIDQFWDGSGSQVAGEYANALAAIQSAGSDYQLLRPGQKLELGDQLAMQALQTDPLLLTLTTQPESDQAQNWLLLGTGDLKAQIEIMSSPLVPIPIDWLWWDGRALSRELLETFQVEAAISGGGKAEDQAKAWFEEKYRPIYETDFQYIPWTPQGVQLEQPLLD